MKEKNEKGKGEMKVVAGTQGISVRGRIFKGEVMKKIGNRIVLEFERTVRVPKYERFTKKKTKLHARVPSGMDVEVGDIVRIRESRPLSKIIHFVVIENMKNKQEVQE